MPMTRHWKLSLPGQDLNVVLPATKDQTELRTDSVQS